jgi:hypothetical protein
MMLTARPPQSVHTKRRRSAIDGKGAPSLTPTTAKVTKAELTQEAWAHVTRKALAPIDFRRAIVGGDMRPSSITSNQTRPIEAMHSASITTSRKVARRARIRAKKHKPEEARERFAVGGANCAYRRARLAQYAKSSAPSPPAPVRPLPADPPRHLRLPFARLRGVKIKAAAIRVERAEHRARRHGLAIPVPPAPQRPLANP